MDRILLSDGSETGRMKELSLNILDVARNSVNAGADRIGLYLTENGKGKLTVRIVDNGCGMDGETLKNCVRPGFTTRVGSSGLGLALMAAESALCGGKMKVLSRKGKVFHGTAVEVCFDMTFPNVLPLGKIEQTVRTLALAETHPRIRFVYRTPEETFTFRSEGSSGHIGKKTETKI